MGKFFEGTGHYYEYISRPTDFWTAYSNSLGSFKHGSTGYLVEINDHAENEFVSNDGQFLYGQTTQISLSGDN